MPAPDPKCGIIPGSAARLYICDDPDAANLEWTLIGDLDNYTIATDATDTNLNTEGWIRTLPMERGMTVTATGRVNTTDEGQIAVDATALETGCGALAFYRLTIPGAKDSDPNYEDVGFWAWANKQDVSAASTDPFSWGVELRLWAPPIDLDNDGQPASAPIPGSGKTGAKRPGATPEPATAPNAAQSGSQPVKAAA